MTLTPEQSTPGTELPSTLPGNYYTDQSIFVREQELIFEREWMYVGRDDQVPNSGDVLRVDVGRENLIIVRGRDGNLRAFLNVCRHRGSLLCVEDQGNVGKAIRCPYHAWTYGLDGKLITAPNWDAMKDLDREKYKLSGVGLEVWQGLIWVCINPTTTLADALNPQLEFRLGTGVDRLDRYKIGELAVAARKEYVVDANWKIIQENFQECYHCGTIHPELVEQIPTFKSFEALNALDGYNQDGYLFKDGRDAFSLSGEAHHADLPGLQEEDSKKYFGMVLRPNAFLSLLPDHVIVHMFKPLGPDKTAVVCDWLFSKEAMAEEGFDPSDTVALFDKVNEQDFEASEWCQPNMGSKSYRNGGALVPLESDIIGNWYYGWYRKAMGEA